MRSPVPSEEESPKAHVSFKIALAIGLLAMLGASISVCGPSCALESCPSPPSEYCQALWNLKRVILQQDRPAPSVKSESSLDKNKQEEEVPQKKRRKNPLAKLFKKRGRKKSKRKSTNSISQFPSAFSPESSPLHRTNAALLSELIDHTKTTVPDFEKRAALVPWGGPGGAHWWSKGDSSALATYLKIMKWPSDLTAKFPFKLCPKGCRADFAAAHTLEWREKYKPWCMSPSGMKENTKGYVYTRGHSPSLKGDGTGHSLVWLRFPIHRYVDPVQWVRAVIHTLDRAVADSLQRTGGRIGRFNAIFDGQGFTLSHILGMGPIKKMVTMLQDHFPDRLGIVLFANFAKPAQMMVNLVKPIITKEVRDKLYLLPDEPEARKDMLDALVGDEFLPHYLGGNDEYRFDANEYYRKDQCTEAETTEYIQTMPYHA
jgi:hypothetical protein